MDFWSMFSETAKIYGIFAALFIALLGWVLYSNNTREQRYLNVIDKNGEIINKLSDNYIEMKNDVEQIKNKLWS